MVLIGKLKAKATPLARSLCRAGEQAATLGLCFRHAEGCGFEKAGSGDAIEIRGDGAIVSEPLHLGNKALRIRAAVSSRPVLLLASAHEQMGEEFLATDAVVLEGT